MKHLLRLSVFAAILNACTSSNRTAETAKNTPTEIITPTKALLNSAPLAEKFTVRVNQPNRIQTANGAEILIPEHSFVHEDGSAVQGNVTIEYTEYNNPFDIISAGIPMQVKYNGQVENFISDGMFNIQGYSAGKSVKLAENKELKVFTAIKDESPDFKYWYLDPVKNEWLETGSRTEPATTQDKLNEANAMGIAKGVAYVSERSKRIAAQSPGIFQAASTTYPQDYIAPNEIIPAAYDPNAMILDFVFDKKDYPELAEYTSIMWQFCGKNKSENPENQKWILNEKWTDIRLKSIPGTANHFDLNFTTSKGPFHTVVRPVVSGQDLEKAKKLYAEFSNENENTSTLAKLQSKGADEAVLNQQLFNAFKIKKMGTYNCDRFYGDPGAVDMEFEFDLEQSTMPNQIIYLLIDDNRNFLTINSQYPKIRINPGILNGAVTVATTGAIAVAKTIKVQKIASNKLSGTINFNPVKKKIFNMETLLEAISNF